MPLEAKTDTTECIFNNVGQKNQYSFLFYHFTLTSYLMYGVCKFQCLISSSAATFNLPTCLWYTNYDTKMDKTMLLLFFILISSFCYAHNTVHYIFRTLFFAKNCYTFSKHFLNKNRLFETSFDHLASD